MNFFFFHSIISSFSCSFAVGLQEDDPVLIEISKFFVDRESVDPLTVVLLKDIPPHGPLFVRETKTADTPWTEVALSAMRLWYVWRRG